MHAFYVPLVRNDKSYIYDKILAINKQRNHAHIFMIIKKILNKSSKIQMVAKLN